MNKPSSISSLATFDVIAELKGFLYSARLAFPGTHIYIACDSLVREYLTDTFCGETTITPLCCLDKFSGKGRQALEYEGLFLELLSMKMKVMKIAVENEGNTLYLDSDVVLLQHFHVNTGCDIQISKAYVSEKIQNETGKYNAGYIWTKSLSFLQKWEESLKDSHYYDQHILQSVIADFSYSFFHRGHNVMPWRLITPETTESDFLRSIHIEQDAFCIENEKVVSIHTHFARADMQSFNKLMIFCLMSCSRSTGLIALSKILLNI